MDLCAGNATDGDIAMIMVVRPNTAVNGFRSDQFTISNMSYASGTVVDGERVQASINVSRDAIDGMSEISFVYSMNLQIETRHCIQLQVIRPVICTNSIHPTRHYINILKRFVVSVKC